MRFCRICRVGKPVSDFWVQRSKRDGIMSACKSCVREQNNDWQRRNRKTRTPKKVDQVNRSRQKNQLRYLIGIARHRAKKKGMECTITINDLIIPSHCPVLGIPLQSGLGKTVDGRRTIDNSPSLDRVDNSLGYTPENTIVVSYRANRFKADASIEEMRMIVEFYDARRRNREGGRDWNTPTIHETRNGAGDLSEVFASQAEKVGQMFVGDAQ